MDVQIDSSITRGMSVVDKLNVAHDARNRAVWSEVLEQARPHKVIREMNIPGWKQSLLQALR
jgi:inosine-uridine nucleoside N-ribohydrolase